jgi:type IV pilus assembly protein PilE
MMKLPKRDGFTLIELLIAMIIIGILASFAVAMLWRGKDRGYEASMRSDLRSLVNDQEVYFEHYHTYASNVTDLAPPTISAGVVLTVTNASAAGWAATATHPSVENRICGIRVGDAPLSAATAAVAVGFAQCTTE